MRLIDADVLEPDADYDDGDYWAVSIAQIQSAPTIEERKKGKWERWYEKLEDASGVEYMPFCRCSECKTRFDPHSAKFINFCPHCGADMRGGKGERNEN